MDHKGRSDRLRFQRPTCLRSSPVNLLLPVHSLSKMPPIREHEVLYEDEDDDMPPLVDYPIQYTFLTDIPPPDSADSIPPSSALPESSFSIFASTPPDSPLSPDDASSTMTPSSTYRGSHGKKRDASYIPRPPNAFILYRSSFIRSQQITGKVEGNHSNLSKIIGESLSPC